MNNAMKKSLFLLMIFSAISFFTIPTVYGEVFCVNDARTRVEQGPQPNTPGAEHCSSGFSAKSVICVNDAGGTSRPQLYASSPCPGGNLRDTFDNPAGVTDFIQIFEKLVNLLVFIAVPILSFVILWGGFELLTSEGNPDKINKGRDIIFWGIVGFILVLISSGFGYIIRSVFEP